ncbi:uncharacterized protein F5Z01DRAFT_622642 [Emericellopsis atlantica]|uniref:Uncharacterized protein n=1 Tax=Emericellopsis atlantica TaxID=2614577 RepID=A0A9P7ZLK8_9HYPO|nr:uncharacterized protein F5Z01DRAFT_622642 [Emericellopsis atlantica]KAG9254186.1 hypothetical protein F5Z01DRAFT_622642 [Emericellopsis atlantica]
MAAQWTAPGDIFSVLLIVGADVIQLACAAMTGGPGLLPTPVAFSFGWVAYAISAMLSALGERRLLKCPPEVEVKVINLASGYARTNHSWLLGRFVKTYPFWMPTSVRAKIKPSPSLPPTTQGTGDLRADRVALCVAVYQWKSSPRPSQPSRDWLWWSGYATSAVQLAVSMIPLVLYRDWTIIMATAAGTALSYASASLPQWRREKWHGRRGSSKPVALTSGNGSVHVIIVEGADETCDLEALAGGPWAQDSTYTVFSTSLLAVLWLALLISCTGIAANTWYLLGIGGMGMLQNIVAAAAPRMPDALGLPVQLVMRGEGLGHDGETLGVVFAEPKVMWALMELEMWRKGYGRYLREEFFPGALRQWEQKWWDSVDVNERTRLLDDARTQWHNEQQRLAREAKNGKSS